MNFPRSALWSFLALAVNPSTQAYSLNDPIATTNQSPFVQIYGLPAAQGAMLTKAGEFSTGFQFEVASNFVKNYKGNEVISIDGETNRANLQLRYGLTKDIELGVDIPYLNHTGGSLDGLIDNWHDFWSLPHGGRPNYPQDQLNYSYRNNGQWLAAVTESQSGVGDASLSLGYQLSATEERYWALRTSLKLPTGDAEYLLGSGSTDIAASIHFTDHSLLQDHKISWHASGGLLWMGSGEVLDAQREDWVIFGSLGLGWLATQNFSLKLQLDTHTAFYDSHLSELGEYSAQLVFGGAFRMGKNWMLDLAISEDIATGTASDVVFHIEIKGREW